MSLFYYSTTCREHYVCCEKFESAIAVYNCWQTISWHYCALHTNVERMTNKTVQGQCATTCECNLRMHFDSNMRNPWLNIRLTYSKLEYQTKKQQTGWF